MIYCHYIGDELFNLERFDGGVRLTHPRWSLEGEGPTLLAAETELLHLGREVLQVLDDPGKLAPDALDMRDFLLRHAALSERMTTNDDKTECDYERGQPCPACGSPAVDIKGKLTCTHCKRIVEGCCE